MHEQNPAAPADRPRPSSGPADSPAASARAALIGQAVLALLGAYVVVTSIGLGLWNHLGPRPGFFPLVLGVSLLLLALSWFIQDRARAARTAARTSVASAQDAAEPAQATELSETTELTETVEPTEIAEPAEAAGTPAGGTGDGSAGRGHIVAILGSLVVLGLLIDLLGFQLTVFAFLLFHLKRAGGVRWVSAVIIALAGSVGTFVLFGAGLGVQLPAAGIPFLANLGL